MSAATKGSNLQSLYVELIRSGESGEFDKALKTAKKILHETPGDEKVLHCKAVCLIHLSEFEEALRVVEKIGGGNEGLLFEKAYCLYRLNKIQEAWTILKSVQNPSWKIRELLAQILYRLEKYDQSFEIYKDLIKNSDDDYEEERETNLAAVVANMVSEKVVDVKKIPQLREHTYELCYNAACVLIARGEYGQAIDKLKAAEELCKKTLEENDAPEEEVEAELAVIRVQIGYVLQMMDKHDRALRIYNQVLKKKPPDTAVVAVASNNTITINKDQNVFDSKKKIKVVTAESLDLKLTSPQRQAIAVNNCLLLLQMNQIEQCRKQVQLLLKKFPSSGAIGSLLQAALHCKEKKIQKAVDVLKEYASNHPDKTVTLSFTLAQLLLMQGHVNQACETLRSLGDLSYTPGVLSALVTLYQSLENNDSAAETLKAAVSWYKKTDVDNPALNTIIRETAKMELKNGKPKEAAKLLEDLRKRDPGDLKSLAQLIAAYSQFDSKKAKEVSKQLPPLSETTLKIDVDNLESTTWTMGAKYVKKGVKTEVSVPMSSGSDSLVQKKKKKKRRKPKLPKTYDPNVDPDPERWLPKRERTGYKKKKDKRSTAIGKGTQGAIAGSEEVSKTMNVPSPTAVPNAASPNVPGPRQQKGVQKKKKKGRW